MHAYLPGGLAVSTTSSETAEHFQVPGSLAHQARAFDVMGLTSDQSLTVCACIKQYY
jgi:hypothetical protein